MTCTDLRQRGGFAEGRLGTGCDAPLEPWNTWSNVAYLVAAALVVHQRPDLMGGTVAAALTLLGVGSGLYHATKRGWANRLDVAGMYASMTALAFASWPLAHDWWAALGTFVAAVLTAYYAHRLWRTWDTTQVMAATLLAGTAGLVAAGAWERLALAYALFGAGYACWRIDQRTTSWRHGHALWHLLTAAAMAVMGGGRG